MEIELLRTYFPKGTNSDFIIDGVLISHAIELPWKENANRISCIPEGRYEVVKRFSEKHGKHLWLLRVPKRALILIHKANNALKELMGCIAPVTTLTGEGLGAFSKTPFDKIIDMVYAEIDKGEKVFITIKKK